VTPYEAREEDAASVHRYRYTMNNQSGDAVEEDAAECVPVHYKQTGRCRCPFGGPRRSSVYRYTMSKQSGPACLLGDSRWRMPLSGSNWSSDTITCSVGQLAHSGSAQQSSCQEGKREQALDRDLSMT
jgi:hypothetical protein